jgi:hypothetical protein
MTDLQLADSFDSPITIDGDWPPRHLGPFTHSHTLEKRTGWMAQRIGSWPVISLDCRPDPAL